MQNSIESMVKEFQQKYGHFAASSPTTDIPEVVEDLRHSLIEEEWSELSKAMDEENLVEIADGIADLVYVLVGTAIAYGIPFDRVFQEVHRSNMTKTAVKAETGQKYGAKTPKGPDYIKPEIEVILKNDFIEHETTLENMHFNDLL